MKGCYLLCLWTFMSKDMMAGCNHSSHFSTMKGTKLKQSGKNGQNLRLQWHCCTAKLMDRGAWRAAVHEAAKSRTQLSSHTGSWLRSWIHLTPELIIRWDKSLYSLSCLGWVFWHRTTCQPEDRAVFYLLSSWEHITNSCPCLHHKEKTQEFRVNMGD